MYCTCCKGNNVILYEKNNCEEICVVDLIGLRNVLFTCVSQIPCGVHLLDTLTFYTVKDEILLTCRGCE